MSVWLGPDNRLTILHQEVDTRVQEIAETHGAWPCRMGCDSCCRSLADVPRFTAPEWQLLREGLSRLPAEVRREIDTRVADLAGASRPIVCPLLDRERGACLVYDYRPVACRTYGFYVERGEGLYCREIQSMVEGGSCEQVVWGNASAVESRLAALGEAADMRIWFQHDS